jgi:hypothetical protein
VIVRALERLPDVAEQQRAGCHQIGRALRSALKRPRHNHRNANRDAALRTADAPVRQQITSSTAHPSPSASARAVKQLSVSTSAIFAKNRLRPGCDNAFRIRKLEAQMNNVQTIEHVYEWFSAGNAPAILATFDPHVEFRLAQGHPYRGDDGGGLDLMRWSRTSS